MPSDVFVSYAADTKPLAEELTRALQYQGIHAWADFKDLQPGQRWRDEVERALDNAGWFVIIVGPDSRSTPWLDAEWRAVLAKCGPTRARSCCQSWPAKASRRRSSATGFHCAWTPKLSRGRGRTAYSTR